MADQPKRVLFIYNKLQSGRRYTSAEIKEMIAEELDNKVSLRSIQRDLKILSETVPSVSMFDSYGEIYWGIEKEYRNPITQIKVDSNELLSYYVLKAHLKAFKGTYIEQDLDELTEKLEEIAPSFVVSEDALFWDQNIGQYDYTQFAPQIKRIIDCIVHKKWVKVAYNTSGLGTINNFKLIFRTIFTYSGFLYVIGYIPHHDTDIALTIHNIEEIDDIDNPNVKVPSFNFKEWAKNRFGVYYGKPEQIKILVKKEFIKYFENRTWHQSQKTSIDENGNMILEFKAPTSIDLISWIMSWSYAVEVLYPRRLRKEIIETIFKTLKNYQRDEDTDS